jgi:hypothetical protein
MRVVVHMTSEQPGEREPEIIIGGTLRGQEVWLRYAPQRDITPWEVATLLRMFVAEAARVPGDWIDWAARHGLLRHFEPVRT